MKQMTLWRLPDGWHPFSYLPLLLHLASAARAESRWHPDGPRVGAILRDVVKDPDSLCLLALPCFILGLLPHGHKEAATTANITCSCHHMKAIRELTSLVGKALDRTLL